jgi:hypothetical protein
LPHIVHVVREIEVKIVMFGHYDYRFIFLRLLELIQRLSSPSASPPVSSLLSVEFVVRGVEIRYGDCGCLRSDCEVILSEKLSELNMAGMFGLRAVVVLSLLSTSL